jgi:hypothetical protein
MSPKQNKAIVLEAFDALFNRKDLLEAARNKKIRQRYGKRLKNNEHWRTSAPMLFCHDLAKGCVAAAIDGLWRQPPAPSAGAMLLLACEDSREVALIDKTAGQCDVRKAHACLYQQSAGVFDSLACKPLMGRQTGGFFESTGKVTAGQTALLR